MTFEEFLHGTHPHLSAAAATALLERIADGLPLPCVLRDAPGGLGEADVHAVLDAEERFDALRERQRFVCEEIARQGRLDATLRATIEATFDRDRLDDLYLPFKRRRRTPAVAAREAGLAPLADWMWNCGHGLDAPLPGQTLALWAFTFRSEAHDVADADAAIAGAEEILVERIAETGTLRARVREAMLQGGWLRVGRGAKAKEDGRFASAVGAHEPIAALLAEPAGADRYLLWRRGVEEEELVLAVDGAPDDPDFRTRLCGLLDAEACSVPDSPGADVLARAARRALDEHVWPAAEASAHKALRAVADERAIADIVAGVERLLCAPRLGRVPVLGVDPAHRGCKLAVVDAEGRFLDKGVLHLEGDERRARASALVVELARRHDVRAVAVGDGPAGREVARVMRAALRAEGVLVPVATVSEAGASAYGASDLGREELPDLDPTVRSAVSIARRLQDPLAELVKMDAKHLALGPYQHDVSPTRLVRALERAVEACVARVGVDPNAAAAPLLARVPGMGPGVARALVEHRAAHGPFAAPSALLAVPLLGRSVLDRAGPFLRLPDGEAPAGDDPRGPLVLPEFRADLRTFADLAPGLACPGVVTNVTTFGAFVDVGVEVDGLVHVSRLAERFVKDAHDVARVGDRVEVRVLEVHPEKRQFALSMRPEPARAPAPPRPRPAPPAKAGKPRAAPPRERRPPAAAFNNPFAGLASRLHGGAKPPGSSGSS
jgi:uncharacterized protein